MTSIRPKTKQKFQVLVLFYFYLTCLFCFLRFIFNKHIIFIFNWSLIIEINCVSVHLLILKLSLVFVFLLQNNTAKSKDDYSDLKKVVFKAEEIGIPGSREARAEFDSLLQRANVPGQRQAQTVSLKIPIDGP